MLIDITRPLSPLTAVWPGDLPTQHTRVAALAGACPVNTHQLHCSLHAATHVDAPYHYDNAGRTIDEIPLDMFVGPATVLRLPDPCPPVITPPILQSTLGQLPLHPRLLLATHAWRDSRSFPMQFPILSTDTPAFLASRGVALLGLDLPSVDAFPATVIPIHLELNRHNILILESLDLSNAPQGAYELLALPLNLPAMEASPVRAVLRPLCLGT